MNIKYAQRTENPKKFALHVRLDDECSAILNMYCEKLGITRAQAMREGISRLKGYLK